MLWAHASTWSASLTSTNEGDSWASHGKTTSTFWQYIHPNNGETGAKTWLFSFILNKRAVRVRCFTCRVFVMIARISRTVDSRSCVVGYISIFSSSNVKDMRNMGKRWELLESNRIANSSTLLWSRNFNWGEEIKDHYPCYPCSARLFWESPHVVSMISPDWRWAWIRF